MTSLRVICVLLSPPPPPPPASKILATPMARKFFLNFLYWRKYDLIRLTPYHWQPCILQFCDIKKAVILQKFSPTKKRDYQLVAVSSLSENSVNATGTRSRPRLPVLIYSRLSVMSHNCEMQVANGTESNGLKRIFANKRNRVKRFGALLY